MDPSYWIVFALVIGAVIGVIQALGNASPYVVVAVVIGIWTYGGSMYEPDQDKTWFAQQVGQFAVGWGGIFQQVMNFIDEASS